MAESTEFIQVESSDNIEAMAPSSIDNTCEPITSYESLFSTVEFPPKWIYLVKEMVPRGDTVIPNKEFPCHIKDSEEICPVRLDKSLVPRTIVCHDMKNGYLLDRFVDPVNAGNGYTFYMWQCIDVFIYFSHHLLTVPPLHWINLAHGNGVHILGTFLTEWQHGEKLCEQIFSSYLTMKKFAEAMVQLCCLFKFDGWLINIENEVKCVPLLIQFLQLLTTGMHEKRPGSLVIWYDSVLESGVLNWQNELNVENICFFNQCDGIFLNYGWTERKLMDSARLAGDRSKDVFVGIDVFSRNTPFNGGLETYQYFWTRTFSQARHASLSIAIFAPGWTHESIAVEPQHDFMQRFLDNDRLFWSTVWPYLYTHPITSLFETDFYVGVDNLHYNLARQRLQLAHVSGCNVFERLFSETYFHCPCLQILYEETPVGIQTPVLMKRCKVSKMETYLHHLQATCVDLFGTYVFFALTNTLEVNSRQVHLNFVLVLLDEGNISKVCLNDLDNEVESKVELRCDVSVNVFEDMDLHCPLDKNLKYCTVAFKVPHKLLHIYGTFVGSTSVVLHGFGIRKVNETVSDIFGCED